MGYPAASDAIYYCHVTDTDEASVLIPDLLLKAIGIVEKYTGRVFAAASSDATIKYFDAEIDVDGQTLYLGNEDLLSVSLDTDSKLVINTGDDSTTKLASSDVVYLPLNATPYYAIKIKGSTGYTWTYTLDPDNEISVTGLWGYSTTPPEDINLCILRLVKWLYNQRTASGDLDRPLLTGDGVTIMPMKLPGDVVTILNNYKKIRVAAP